MISIDLIVVLVYLLAMILLGYFRSRGEHLSGFTVNERKTSTIMLMASNLSTVFGMGSLLGVASEAYRTGISYGASVLFVVIGSFLLMSWLAPKIKRFGDSTKAQSLADFFLHKYSLKTSVLVAGLTTISFIIGAAIQFVGAASLTKVLIGISWETALILSAAVTIIYTVFGGLRNDIATDFIQFWIIIITFFSMAIIGVFKYGGVSTITTLPDSYFSFFAYAGPVFFVGSLVLGALGHVGYMDNWQRSYSGVSDKAVRKAFLGSFGVSLPLYILPILFGLWARTQFPGIDAEQAFFVLMKDMLPVGLLGIGYSAILATAMSSIDSAIVVVSICLTNDFYHRLIKPHAQEHVLLGKARLFAVCGSILALGIAYLFPNIAGLSILSLLITLVFVPAILGGFVWKRANAKAAFLSVLLGAIVLAVAWFTIGNNAWLPSFLTSVIVFVAGSMLAK
ncbi:sodium:solute symporter family protein [Candidatus Woesearchaeota archaeon]|nr:sodium:solute symporter family protein [Candidatus Woesearchaeota archaeon]